MVLTLTMVLMTGLAITRERERGPWKICWPCRDALEVMTGKLIPYIGIGLIQGRSFCWPRATYFRFPSSETSRSLSFGAAVYRSQFTVGITFSSLAQNQLQAVQLAIFFFLPTSCSRASCFPFEGMRRGRRRLEPVAAYVFPAAHTGNLLKGNGWADSWPSVWPMMASWWF